MSVPLGGGMSGGPGLSPRMGSTSLGSIRNPAAGLMNPASGAIPPAAPGSDFSRGFGAGLNAVGGGSSSPPLLPPPSAPPRPVASGAPAGGLAAGPAQVMPAAAPTPTPIAPVSSASAPIAPVVMPPPGTAGGGPLPPFGSDLPRQAAITPAAGPASPTPPPAAAPAVPSSSIAPLPPGVLASGVGATAAGAGLGIRSSAPDPLLESASVVVYQLMHASRIYSAIDWCAGVFKTSSGTETVVVSSEGAGFIPSGVFVPRSARMLFSDPHLSNGFRARWFAWVNPAQTMLAYAALCSQHDPNVELWALAVSTDHGGSAAPARDAGVRHYEDCSLLVSPIAADAPAASLDETHVHRLETLDRGEYARVIGATGQGAPDYSEALATTLAAVRLAMARASNLLGFSVPPVIRHVASALANGEPVTGEQWNELELARLNATLDSASQRPGRMLDNSGVTPYARAHHNLARSAELLGMWREDNPPHAEIYYTARQITTEASLWPMGND
jgi:hypothetical protein